MSQLSLAELMELLDVINASRRGHAPANKLAEDTLEVIFAIRETLASYGSLAPGRKNHHIVEPLGGNWTEGFVEGDLLDSCWGSAIGYPAFLPKPGGPAVKVFVLRSAKLASAWERLDDFEGVEYLRILVPVFANEFDRNSVIAVANLYEMSDPDRV